MINPIKPVKTGMNMFKAGRNTGVSAVHKPTPSMHKTTWYDPKLGKVEYLTPQGKRFSW